MKFQIQRYLFVIILFSLGFGSHGEAHNPYQTGFWAVESLTFDFFAEEETESETDELHEFNDNVKIDKGSGGSDKSTVKHFKHQPNPAFHVDFIFHPFFRLINLQTNKAKALAFVSDYLNTPYPSLFLLFQRFKLDTPSATTV